MTMPGGNDPNGSIRAGRVDQPASGTTSGADATARMTGTGRTTETETVRPTGARGAVMEHKTSAAAALSLVFGVSALISGLAIVLSPVAVLLGIIGIVLGIAGLNMAKRPGVTGRGVATGGLITSVLGLLLGALVIGGVSWALNDEARLDQIQQQVEDLRSDVPSTTELRDELPN